MNDENKRTGFPNRNYVRLTNWDYSSPGAYYVTICTQNKQCLFGDIKNGTMALNQFGEIVRNRWKLLQHQYIGIDVEIFTVMPNHIHGIIFISEGMRRSGFEPDPTKKLALPEIIRGFKTNSARSINTLRNSEGVPVWQRSFYEHVLRTEKEFHEIGEYILNNPAKWETDCENKGHSS